MADDIDQYRLHNCHWDIFLEIEINRNMTENKKKKVLLAFSGGLDTSFAVKYLSEDLGYEVHTAIANTGGFSEEELK